MAVNAAELSDEEKRGLATYVAGGRSATPWTAVAPPCRTPARATR